MATSETVNNKILIAEDELALSTVLHNKLGRHGFDVEVAADGEEALAKMRALKPQLVLLDLVMPNKNGFQVLEEVNADPSLKGIKIIVFSNLNQEEDRERVKKLGAADFFVKSDTAINDVVAMINKFLQKA